MDSDALDAECEQVVAQAATLFDRYESVSRVIGKLDLPTDQLEDNYDSSGDDIFEFGSMVRLFIYMKVGGYSQKQLAERIENWVYLQSQFGLNGAPRQATISYTNRHRFSTEVRLFISTVADGIRLAAEEAGVRSKELEPADPTPKEMGDSDLPLHHYVDSHAPEIISTGLDEVFPTLDTGRAPNAKHADRAVWEHQLLMSLQPRAGTRGAYRTFNKFRSDALHHDTHTRAVKKLGTPSTYQYTLDQFTTGKHVMPEWRRIADTILPQFTAAVKQQLERLRQSEQFTEPVAAAIDVTGIPYHVTPWKGKADITRDDEGIVVDSGIGKTKVPKDDYPTMVNGGEDPGVYEYQYATLTIVGRNAPIVVAVEPIRHHSTWECEDGMSVSWAEVVDRLMEQATDLVDIHLVMADKAFDWPGVFHVLDQRHDVNYLIPKKADSEHLRKQAEEVSNDPAIRARVERDAPLHLRDDTPYIDPETDSDVDEDNLSHELTFMHVPADRNDWIIRHVGDTGYAIFVTNRDDMTPLDAEGLTNRYSDRWDIEIGYKMIQPLLPSIASTDYRMRFFVFIFSCLVYNLWRIVDHELKDIVSERFDDYGRGPHEERLATILPLADLLASSIICMFRGLDPPDKTL